MFTLAGFTSVAGRYIARRIRQCVEVRRPNRTAMPMMAMGAVVARRTSTALPPCCERAM